MHALQRTDLFPLGDIALVNSLKETKQLHPQRTKEALLTIASMILYHTYIKKRNIKIVT